MSYPSITFPKHSASSLQMAMDQIFDLFPDHYPVLVDENESCWEFNLEWPAREEWFVDPDLPIQVEQLYQLKLKDIPTYFEVHKWTNIDFVFSMFHSRALLAVSKALSRLQDRPIKWIVHVDHHTDLMDTPLNPSISNGELYSSIYDHTLNIGSWESVIRAVNNGVVSKGNFLSAYLAAFKSGTLIHVHHSLGNSTKCLIPEPYRFSFAGRELEGVGIAIRDFMGDVGWVFHETPSIPIDLPLEGNEAVWLDIDLDAFCNRYDGDSDLQHLIATDEEQFSTIERIDLFLNELASVSWMKNVQAVSVAASPGFFPSIYWAYAIPKVCTGIKDILCKETLTNFQS